MQIRKRLESRIAEQQRKIAQMQLSIAEEKAYLSGLQDSLKMVPAMGSVDVAPPSLREGSDLAKARDLLKAEGRHLHINEILKKLGKEVSRINKAALGGSISAYVRKGQIFTRPAPNAFGLVEFNASNPPMDVPDDLPDDFGIIELPDSK